MKTTHKILAALTLTLAGLFAATPGKAQIISGGYFHIDWQVNVPLGNDFTSKTSGWGMNFEGGYYVTDKIGVGGFFAYQTNQEYIPRQTLPIGLNGAVTTDQQHSLFQLPFGVSGRYRLSDGSGIFDPYVGLKMGAQFARARSYFSAYGIYQDSWGFYLSPEVGTTIYPFGNRYFGFHVAAYYSYGTNKVELLQTSMSGLNNFGIRVGVSF